MTAFDDLASLDPIQPTAPSFRSSATVTQGLSKTQVPPDKGSLNELQDQNEEAGRELEEQSHWDNKDRESETSHLDELQDRNQQPNQQTRRVTGKERYGDREADIDKFATLFSPSTPRASPTLVSQALPDVGDVAHIGVAPTQRSQPQPQPHSYRHRRTLSTASRASTSSQQSDFGAFVSVPASEDPLLLSADFLGFADECVDNQIANEGDGVQTPMLVTPTTATAKTHAPLAFGDLYHSAEGGNSSSLSDDQVDIPQSISLSQAPNSASSLQVHSDPFPSSTSSLSSLTKQKPRMTRDPSFSSISSLSSNITTSTTQSSTTTNTNSSNSTSSKSSSNTNSSASTATSSTNPTLSFFDQFAQDARARTARRSALLEELLMHEDDPMYFVKGETATSASASSASVSQPVLPLPSSPAPSNPHGSESPFNLGMDREVNVTHDLDHDYFRTPPPLPSNPFKLNSNANANDYNPTSSTQQTQTAPHHSLVTSSETPHQPRQLTRRSSSILMPAAGTLAPPVHSPSEGMLGAGRMVSSPPVDENLVYEHVEREGDGDEKLDRAQGLTGSLSSLPGKWMSTLLRGAPAGSHQGGSAKATLESIFDHPHPSAQDPVLGRRSSPSPSPRHPPQPPTFTHANAFSPPPPPMSTSMSTPLSISPSTSSLFLPPQSTLTQITHSASPFAPHIFIPPSGAPGFGGERELGMHAWEGGMAEALEAERRGVEKGGKGESTTQKEIDRKAKTLPPMSGSGSGFAQVALDSKGAVASTGRRERESSGGSASSASSSKGWGSGFGFSFGSIRTSKTSTSAPASGVAGHGGGSGNAKTWGDAQHGKPYPTGHKQGDSNGIDPIQWSASGLTSVSHSDGFGSAGKGQDGSIGAFIERKAGKVELAGRKASTTPVLNEELAVLLRPSLPALSRLPRIWTLIYSLDQHGISLNTLYARCEAHATRRAKPGEVLINAGAMLVVVKDAQGALFGAWLSEGVRMEKKGKGYFGGGESFLWKFVDGVLKVFKCTGKNHYVTLCDPDYISFGGGDGHSGLYLDETLYDGTSAPCPTFDNEPLCAPGPHKGVSVSFECVGLEVWGLGG
ncbi:Oxidation resistance protein 1 [Psilocybe cubensis]|uniref:Oxidation resistance protein 1 n=2 Tax=Psilocybe cubensis TaxID=181762 RepID=A0A8H7XJM9_PSICU|nr:Oxidation resistance protein 1 [Psilocybe cubensis]KAH9476519.1 Oxidation resistance protein 1 [Psilocybe cubensis]